MPVQERVLDLGTRIAPFGDRAADLPLLGRSLRSTRRQFVTASGASASRFTFADYALATPAILSAFAARPGPAVLALPAEPRFAALAPVSSIRSEDGALVYDVFLDAPADASLEALRALPRRLVPVPGRVHPRALPRLGPGPDVLELPADGAFAAHLEHWVHLLWIAPLLVPLLTPAPRFRNRGGNRIGRGARIHPTAQIEGSVIGDGAQIGAFCSIRHSYVGGGAHLADYTKLAHAVLGEEMRTLADSNIFHSVALGQSTLSNLGLEDSLIGRGSFLTTGVIFWSHNVAGTTAVEHHGQWVDTGRQVLGGCAGHQNTLGARTIIAPGRALPNGTTVVMRKEEGVAKIPRAQPGTPLCWGEAALIPFSFLRPDTLPEEVAP